jgi:hypothetical protein
MRKEVFKTKRSFLVPIFAVVVLLFLLFLISLYKGQKGEQIILALLFIIPLSIAIETSKREIIVSEKGLIIRKFLRRKEFDFSQITHLAVIALKKNVYFLLTTTKGSCIFSNLLENHVLLIRSLIDRLGPEKVEGEVKTYLEHPVERLSMVVMSWIAVSVLLALIILKVTIM